MHTTCTGSHAGSELGFLPGGGIGGSFSFNPGGSFQFETGRFDFGTGSGFEINPGGNFNFDSGFSFNQDVLGSLPTSLPSSELPSFSQNDYSGQGDGISWDGLVKKLLELGPQYIEAFRRGEVDAPPSAPRDAQSSDPSRREEALRRAIQRLKRQDDGTGGGGIGGGNQQDGFLSGIDTTTAVLGAGVAASLAIAVSQS